MYIVSHANRNSYSVLLNVSYYTYMYINALHAK